MKDGSRNISFIITLLAVLLLLTIIAGVLLFFTSKAQASAKNEINKNENQSERCFNDVKDTNENEDNPKRGDEITNAKHNSENNETKMSISNKWSTLSVFNLRRRGFPIDNMIGYGSHKPRIFRGKTIPFHRHNLPLEGEFLQTVGNNSQTERKIKIKFNDNGTFVMSKEDTENSINADKQINGRYYQDRHIGKEILLIIENGTHDTLNKSDAILLKRIAHNILYCNSFLGENKICVFEKRENQSNAVLPDTDAENVTNNG